MIKQSFAIDSPLAPAPPENGGTAPPFVQTADGGAAQPDFFATRHLETDLARRSVRGASATLAAQGASFGLRLGSTAILARILTPADYGLIAMVTAITGLLEMFRDAGLSTATVQRQHVTQEQVSTLFWINLALSALLMAVTAAIAPAIAWFYGEPRLVWVAVALGGSFLFGGLTVQHQALLRRQMQFTSLAIIQVVSLAAGIAAAIAAALAGWRYWALVIMIAAQAAANAALVWRSMRWRPSRPCAGSGVGPMLGFGAFYSGAGLLIYLRRVLDNVLIGAAWGAPALGIYQKAYQLLLLPMTQINGPVSAVVVPALSRLQSDPASFRAFHCSALRGMSALAVPLAAFTAVSASEIVLVLLGERWLEVTPIFLALVPAALVGTLSAAGGWVFVALGRVDRQFRANLCVTGLAVAGFAAGLPWGALGVSVAVSVTYLISFLPLFAYAFRGSPLRLSDVWTAVRLPVAASACAALACLLVKNAPAIAEQSPFVLLPGMAVLFGSAYAVGWLVLPGGKQELRNMRLAARRCFSR